jgi:DNA-directed RNA polymerase specialized sigma subunit
MIRNEKEYKNAVRRMAEQEVRLNEQAAQLKQMKLSKDDIKRVLDPVRSFHEQIKEEVASYERLKRGEFDELQNLSGIGRLLIALRIAKGLTQRELAERLDVSETQVSRDERNEYHGITVDRANRILEVLEVKLTSAVSSPG